MPKGIILSNKSNLYKVEQNNIIYDCNARGKFKNEDISPVAGDKVEIEIIDSEKKSGIITEIYERVNFLKRPKMANLSQIILVISMKLPKPDLLLLDKQLAYSELIKVKPIICLNKIDLESEKKVDEIYNLYTKIGYKVITTNAKTGEGIDKIKTILNNNITAFSGNSGVGKSSLINKILDKDTTLEGSISEKNKRGKNTTTQVTLYKIGTDSYIADTPGFSTFDITEIDKKDLANYFKEFKQYIGKCEFADCKHIKEENCAIKNAVKEGFISSDRYERFVNLSK